MLYADKKHLLEWEEETFKFINYLNSNIIVNAPYDRQLSKFLL